jgi:HK97 family phage major capsid protein
MDILNSLLAQRANVWEQAKAHLDTVEAEGREFTGEADETWTRFNTDLDALDKRIGEVKDLIDREKAADEARSLGDDLARRGAPAPDAVETDVDRLRKLVNGEVRAVDFRAESRDLSKLSAGAGANVVPTSFHSMLQEHMIDSSAIRQTNVTVLTTESGENLQVPKTAGYSTASLIAEAGSITESDPSFGQVTLGAFKYAILVQVSSELLTDEGVDVAEFLARQGGRALGNGSGAHFVAGDGSSKPLGVVPASTLGKTAAGAAAITTDELIDLFYSVIHGYRQNGTWMMADATVALVRKLKDSTNQYLWSPGLISGEVDTLLGRPVVVDVNMPAATTGLKSVVFGDFSAYYIRDVNGVRVERSDDFAFQNDLATFRFILRTDGDLIDTTGAVKHLIQA